MTLSAHLPAQLHPAVDRSDSSGGGPFPEFQLGAASDRYLPRSRPLGVCISGGGPRSYSAAIGQLRGLVNHPLGNLLDLVGAISCVSGGTWFGTPFFYAPASIGDDVLLGPLIPPEQLTAYEVEHLHPNNLGAPLLRLTNSEILLKAAKYEWEVAWDGLPENRVWSRMLGDLLLAPWGLNEHSVFFTLSGADNLVSYAVRPDRPYFIANATQVYPTGPADVRRHFEYTPLYCGTAQTFTSDLPPGRSFGGGYVSSFAFDSHTPISASPATVSTPDPIFLLSDVIGSSGAAPGAELDSIGLSDVGFPEFNYWPPDHLGQVPSFKYSLVDGGNLEDTGIVPLLRRQYPYIIALVNAELPLESASKGAVDGVSGQVSRLFGLIPEETLGNDQDTQVFGATKQEGRALFGRLVQGLMDSQHSGAAFADTYTIFPSNSFEIPPYPEDKSAPYLGGGQVRVLWYYLNLNSQWANAIGDSRVRTILGSRAMSNFPNYNTVFQNSLEVLLLTPAQIQLLAHMTAYTLTAGRSAEALESFHQEATACS